MLEILDLSREVNFTFEKLLGHYLLLILFAFNRISVFQHLTLVCTVNVLWTLVKRWVIVQLVSAWLYGGLIWLVDIWVSVFSLFLFSVFLEVKVRNVASLLVSAVLGVSQRRLCEDHFWVCRFFRLSDRRLVVLLVLMVPTRGWIDWRGSILINSWSFLVQYGKFWWLIGLIFRLHNSFLILENRNAWLNFVVVLLLGTVSLVVLRKWLVDWLNGYEF